LIQQARNEAHRFAITFHRNKRSQHFTKTELTDIPGVGAKTAEKLLQHFGSVKKIRQAQHIEIAEVTSLNVAKKVKGYFEEE
jgi:excinuclease ABC subunit C